MTDRERYDACRAAGTHKEIVRRPSSPSESSPCFVCGLISTQFAEPRAVDSNSGRNDPRFGLGLGRAQFVERLQQQAERASFAAEVTVRMPIDPRTIVIDLVAVPISTRPIQPTSSYNGRTAKGRARRS